MNMYVQIYHFVATELNNSYPSTMYRNCPKEISGLRITKSCFICLAVTTKRQTHVVSHITISQPRTKGFHSWHLPLETHCKNITLSHL